MPYYAVANGRTIGICMSWTDCKSSVNGYKNALYKKFDKKEEADEYIQANKRKYSNDIINNPIPNIMVDDPDYYVYTDGACSNNGKPTAEAGIGIFFGINDIRNVSKKIKGKQTNNIAELTAIIETYYIIENDIINGKNVAIVSDSEYAIKCVSSYGEKCSNQGWDVNIPNKEFVKTAYELYKNKKNIQFIHIKAHTSNTDIHSTGNDNADKLANAAIGLDKCPYNKLIDM